jgi:hypothetical protein
VKAFNGEFHGQGDSYEAQQNLVPENYCWGHARSARCYIVYFFCSDQRRPISEPVDNTDFREDVNADGFLDSADIALAKSKSGTALP